MTEPVVESGQRTLRGGEVLLGVEVYDKRWLVFFFSSRRRHTRLQGDWSSDVCSSDLHPATTASPSWTAEENHVEEGSFRYWVDRNHGGPGGLARFAASNARGREARSQEIGRASCRERV